LINTKIILIIIRNKNKKSDYNLKGINMELQQKPAVDQSLIAVVTAADEIINYQNGSVVSRTVIKKPTGTVTYFAFDEGEGLSEHTAPFDALVSIIDGTAEVIISGKPFIVSAGEMIIMPANEPHALKAINKFKMMLVMIKD
jgi:quercetin dioxygenase-like cupin family protein